MKHKIFLIALLLFLSLGAQAWAVPDLQLYSNGATYDTATETWIIGSNDFTLLVIAANQNIYDVKLSAAVPDDEIGTVTITGYTSTFHDDSTPIMGNGSPLPSHGIFPADFYEFNLGDFIVSSSTKVGDYTNSPTPGLPAVADGKILSLSVAITGFSEVHFDAYDHIYKSNGNIQYKFAPFSHDAETAPVPEPGIMLLLGSGLVGLAGFGRRRVKKS